MRQQYNFVKQSGGAGESDTFDSDLKDLAEIYSDPHATRTKVILDEIQAVKEVMLENMELILERGEKLEELLAKTDDIREEAAKFKEHSHFIRHIMWWKNSRIWIILGVIAFVRFLGSDWYFRPRPPLTWEYPPSVSCIV